MLKNDKQIKILDRDYLIGQNFGGQNCRESDLLPKILSAEKFCPPKMLSAEIFCPLKSKECQIIQISC